MVNTKTEEMNEHDNATNEEGNERSNEDVDSDNDEGSGSGKERSNEDIDSDNGEGSGDDLENETPRLNERRLLQIKHNDPSITSLWVHWEDSSFATSVDWKQEGYGIGENTHLKKLTIYTPYQNHPKESTKEKFEEFCKGLAHNRSIEHLDICECDLNNGTIFAILSPFFQYNGNLCSLDVGDCMLGIESFRLLALALSRCNTSSLERLELGGNEMGDEPAGDLIAALNGHHNLVKLSLRGNRIGRNGCVALGNLLQNPNIKLTELDLGDNSIDDECAFILANALTINKTLKKSSLARNRFVTPAGWPAFSAVLHNPNSSLEEIALSANNIDDEVAATLAHALANNRRLKALDLSQSHAITPTGWRTFFNLLQDRESALMQLELADNSIDDEGAAATAAALANISTLQALRLDSNRLITWTGWQVFSTLLQSPNITLKTLFLNENNINDEAMIAFANALANNTSLNTLWFGDNYFISTRGWAALSNVLCNISSINATFFSNHTLQEVCYLGNESRLPNDLVYFLQLNGNEDKFEVARQKILQHHFVNGHTNLQEFGDMKLRDLPCAIAWMSRNNSGYSLMYRFFRSMPSLFDSDNKMKGVGAKRRRSC